MKFINICVIVGQEYSQNAKIILDEGIKVYPETPIKKLSFLKKQMMKQRAKYSKLTIVIQTWM